MRVPLFVYKFKVRHKKMSTFYFLTTGSNSPFSTLIETVANIFKRELNEQEIFYWKTTFITRSTCTVRQAQVIAQN